ncbi:MAG: hypothetical protein IPH75_02865 [bacterium]|nr:hypothetical protein [bacterium]
MRHSFRLWIVLTIQIVALTAITVQSANRPDNPDLKKQPVTKPTVVLDQGNGAADAVRTRSLVSINAAVDSRGALVAQTWRDWQANSTIGRTVDFTPPSSGLPAVQFAFIYKASTATLDRNHWGWGAFEAVSPGGSFVPPGGLDIHCGSDSPPGSCSNVAGVYPKIAVDQEGAAYLAGYEFPDIGTNPNLTQLKVTRDSGPIDGDFGGILDGSVMAESVRDAGGIEGGETFWPTMDISEFGGVTTIYLAAFESVTGNDGAMKVFRKVGWSEANPDNSWELVFVDTSFFPSQDISCDRVSSKVAVTWTKMTEQGRLAENVFDSDVWYAESPTGASGTWTRTNVTNYSGSGYRAWLEVASLYDYQSRLHLVWNASVTDGVDFGSRRCRLFHWSQWHPTIFTTVYRADWDPADIYCSSGSNAMNVAKFSIAECDNRLFVVFSSFNDPVTGHSDDCCASAPANQGANGEIFVSVSGGLSGIAWDSPRNISSSYTPACDTGTCADDQLLGVSRYGMDDALYPSNDWSNAVSYAMDGGTPGNKFIQVWYMTDKYPGGSILSTPQGPPTLNDMRWIRLACNPTPKCKLIATPAYIDYPTTVEPGIQSDMTLSLYNQCSVPLAISSAEAVQFDGPAGWLAVSNVPSTINGSDSGDVTVHLNNGGVLTNPGAQYHGYLKFRYGSPVDSITVGVDLWVHYPYVPSVYDTVVSQCGISLTVNSIGNMGNNYLGGVNMNFPQPSPECDTGVGTLSRGDADIYLGDASPVIIRKPAENTYVASWAIFQDGFASQWGFRQLAESSPRGSFTGARWDGYNSGTFCTSDSLVKVEKTWYAPTGATNADSCTFIIQRMRVFPYSIGQSVTNLAIGEAFDWDIPTDSGTSNNIGGFDATRRLLYMRGFNSSDAGVDCYDNSLRYGGAALIRMHMKNCVSSTTLYAGLNAANDTFVYPAGGFVPEQQWNQMKSPGYSTEPRITDLHSMLVYKNEMSTGWTLPANDTLTIWTAMAVTRPTGGTPVQVLDSLKRTIDKAVAWTRNVQTTCLSCCVGTTGDVNGDGKVDVGDISAIINGLIFPPLQTTCLAEANVNASPTPTPDLSDLSLLIAYLTATPRPILPNCPQ